MALSALFLMVFLLQHFAINILSVFSPNTFNDVSHFMGTFPLVQYVLQPVLIFGVVFHFAMGFVLEIRNNKAREVKYAKNNGAANSTWMSRNMIYSGGFILAFIILHFIDFWIPELNTKFIQGDMSGMHEVVNASGQKVTEFRYYAELQHKFAPIWRVALYCIGFIFLSLHLMHGFNSAFQSVGSTAGRTKIMKNLGKAYSIILPLGFIFIAIYHFINQH
jgi:succinate dehydrogenase / fumarate reductase cytochrome b subunit